MDEDLAGLKMTKNIIENSVFLGGKNFFFKPNNFRHHGLVADFNMWDYPLTIQEMVDWTTCNNMFLGNIVDWTNSTWKLVEMYELYLDVSSICKELNVGLIVLPEKRTFEESSTICRFFGGRLPTVEISDLTEMQKTIMSSYCSGTYYEFMGEYNLQ